MTYLDEIKSRYDIKDHVESPVKIPELPTEGIVLIVGTSGSGKTTTLYAALAHINGMEKNIITLYLHSKRLINCFLRKYCFKTK